MNDSLLLASASFEALDWGRLKGPGSCEAERFLLGAPHFGHLFVQQS
jgi:hypothetical protein